jgi:hypothetical protein
MPEETSTVVVVPEAATILPSPERMPLDGACPAPKDGAETKPGGVDWTKVPVIEVMPRPGNFFIAPTASTPPAGPGYYSLKDLLTGNRRDKPPFNPYPPFAITANSTFNYDFRYLDKPDNTQFDFWDPIKRMHFGDNWMLGLGGEMRWRYMNEIDSRFTGKDNDYVLQRARFDVDLYYRDRIRIFAEAIDARIFDNDLPPLLIDKNPLDILNLFADVKMFEAGDAPAIFRIGRQELLYGSQRLISPLDWANTRRTFQGIKGFWHSEKLDIDAFWVQPVIVNPTKFDSVDDHQGFAGLWTTYRPAKGQSVDLYYLYLDNTNPIFPGKTVGRITPLGPQNVSTFGSRYYGDFKHALWDFEGMYQFGDRSNQGIGAGAFIGGLGYQFADLPMNPQIWVYNDWYSGNHNPNRTNLYGTFNQLFPFGHYYMGFTDLVGQQNIDDLHLNFYINPTRWITMGLEYHIYRLDAAKDSLYNSAGAPILTDRTGRAGTDVGDELDWTCNFHLTQHMDIFVGYSKLFSGQFVRQTSHNSGSPELFYLMYAYKF